ncbi:hypothetical protein [Streptomyces sp. NPDC046909]|uniref:hypothetical protein n=1 Tax=Streptomyces sp. NPDC046909 TaxID=3155617 RepID=UPI0033FD03F6
MLTSLLEILLFGAGAVAAGALARAANRRRAVSRASGLADSGTVRFPCRISWPAGTGKKAFVYGKVAPGADGQLTFTRRIGSPVPLPRSGSVHIEPSWRTGLVTLRYGVPGQGDVRMLLSAGDAATVEGLLRAA